MGSATCISLLLLNTGYSLCFKEFFSRSGDIHVDSYDDLEDYTNDYQICLARILAPPDSDIEITFYKFNVDCNYYAVEVMLFFFQWAHWGNRKVKSGGDMGGAGWYNNLEIMGQINHYMEFCGKW